MTSSLDILNQVATDKAVSPVMRSFLEHTMCAESSGRANVKCPTSSAYGLFQIVDGTWAALVKKHPGELTMSGRSDPRQQVIAGYYYAQENAASLKNNGHEVTQSHLYLAHFLGAGGANKVLSAAPGTSLAAVVGPAVMSSNQAIQLEYDDRNGVHRVKKFADFTVGDLRAWSAKKMGGRIRYDMLDRDIQTGVEPWTNDEENPKNNFSSIGDMKPMEIFAALLIGIFASLFSPKEESPSQISPLPTGPISSLVAAAVVPSRKPTPARG